ncbi:hypothetical protein [Ruminococcus gauvreauii]|uniref:Uncharacterized protein n=1 Tax=Ruminococcus gauvreauii TaxID=438033 RepID=A0ABY5VL76_9FIRM|nr:hypothetical protein [Ruminococcus gauvreauii]UWP60788.1 hypothetical protein NQ502_07060 [Ruminococcus gauvreauii]
MVKKKSVSWLVVILLLIVFWPVGLYFLYKKISTDKAAAMKNSKVLSVIGWIFVAIGIIGSMGSISDKTVTAGDLAIGLVFFVGGGILMLYSAKKVKMSGEKYKKYINIVINNQQTSIENIASAMSMNQKQVVKDLEAMIDRGYFSNAYIDHGNSEIVLPHNERKNKDVVYAETSQTLQQEVVVCKNCGANNLVTVGTISECEYCGSPIIIE